MKPIRSLSLDFFTELTCARGGSSGLNWNAKSIRSLSLPYITELTGASGDLNWATVGPLHIVPVDCSHLKTVRALRGQFACSVVKFLLSRLVNRDAL